MFGQEIGTGHERMDVGTMATVILAPAAGGEREDKGLDRLA